jgi:hypothetical protein
VIENRVLTRMFGPKRKEVAGDWRRLHNEELHNLYASPNIIRVIKSGRMIWTEHVARMREMRIASIFWLENLKVKDHSEDLSVDGNVILGWIYIKVKVGVCLCFN